MVSSVAPLLAWTLLAASFLLGLAAVIRMAGPAAAGLDAPRRGVIRLPREVTATIVTLFALAAARLPRRISCAARGPRRQRGEDGARAGPRRAACPPWLRALKQIAVARVLRRPRLRAVARRRVPRRHARPGAGRRVGGGAASRRQPPSSAPPARHLDLRRPRASWRASERSASPLWVAFGDRLARRDERRRGPGRALPLAAAVEDSLEDLRAEPDPRRAIIRCYARFERAAADSGVERKPWLTPMEFMREALRRLPLPRAAVPTLTGLFELARFSHHALGPSGARPRARRRSTRSRRRCEATRAAMPAPR